MATNVVAKQMRWVEITYDLDDVDDDLMKVKLLASSDGGNSFDLLVNSTEGDIGGGIASGKGKTIIWHAGQAAPNFYHTNVFFEVVADDGVKPKDRSEMILIPAGLFEMGDHFNEGSNRELPVHRVKLDAFYIDTTEVAVGQFKRFLNQTGYKYGGNWHKIDRYSPTDDHPMTYVK
ncbi:hypothetical protein CMK12_02115 [Candidatus Poribacteria bacterium]|nr:hypothetical protein [Candidatus Poribacteria bacterium]